MVTALQALGVAYLLVMIYLTFLYYKRNSYSVQSFVFWIAVWLFGSLLLLLPESTSIITQKLAVARTIDFYLIVGLMFFSIITFLNAVAVRRSEAKVDELVRRIALQKRR